MDIVEFSNEYHDADDKIDQEHLNQVISRSIESNLPDGYPRGHKNLIIVMEELAELSQEISKEIRGTANYYNTLQELADVVLGIEYVKNICFISDEELHKAMNVKLNRLERVLDKDGIYK